MKRKVNPNRMMLLRQRRRLELARRGHKLLKTKQEKLMQNFFALVKETTELRRSVEDDFLVIGFHFLEGRAATGRQQLEDALGLSTKQGELRLKTRNEMNVKIPVFEFTMPEGDPAYSVVAVSPELDNAFEKLFGSIGGLLRLT